MQSHVFNATPEWPGILFIKLLENMTLNNKVVTLWLQGCLIYHHKPFRCWINTLRPRQHDRHFTDDFFKCVLLKGNVWISIKVSVKFVPKVKLNHIPALDQIMAWHHPGDKPLSKAMMVRLPMHIWVTRPQWVDWRKNVFASVKFIKVRKHEMFWSCHINLSVFQGDLANTSA